MTGQPVSDARPPRWQLARDPWFATAVGAMLLAFAIPATPWLASEFRELFANYLSTILWLALAVLAVLSGIGRLESSPDKTFWRFLACAFVSWLAGEVLLAADLVEVGDPTHGMAIDALYLLYYLGIMLALDARPHAAPGSSRARTIRHLARAGRTVFVIGLFGYFVVIPRVLMPAAYMTWIPSYHLYIALDLYLVGRLVHAARVASGWRWRTVYGLLSVGLACVLVTDSLDLAWISGRVTLESPGPFDLLYFLPFFLLVVASRVRHLVVATHESLDVRDDPDRIRGVPLLAYSLSFPTIHLLLGLFDQDPESLRNAHAILVLAVLALLGGLNVVQDSLIDRWAREQRRRREEAEAQSRFLSRHDPLTGLLNRRELERELKLSIARADRTERMAGVMFIDLDGFKEVNDVHGHQVGDAVLQEVAGRFRGCIREVDILSRYGGDEFVLVLETLERRDDASVVARRILGSLNHSFTFGGQELDVAASIGIAVWPESGRTMAELLDAADKAMYAVKASGGAGASFT